MTTPPGIEPHRHISGQAHIGRKGIPPASPAPEEEGGELPASFLGGHNQEIQANKHSRSIKSTGDRKSLINSLISGGSKDEDLVKEDKLKILQSKRVYEGFSHDELSDIEEILYAREKLLANTFSGEIKHIFMVQSAYGLLLHRMNKLTIDLLDPSKLYSSKFFSGNAFDEGLIDPLVKNSQTILSKQKKELKKILNLFNQDLSNAESIKTYQANLASFMESYHKTLTNLAESFKEQAQEEQADSKESAGYKKISKLLAIQAEQIDQTHQNVILRNLEHLTISQKYFDDPPQSNDTDEYLQVSFHQKYKGALEEAKQECTQLMKFTGDIQARKAKYQDLIQELEQDTNSQNMIKRLFLVAFKQELELHQCNILNTDYPDLNELLNQAIRDTRYNDIKESVLIPELLDIVLLGAKFPRNLAKKLVENGIIDSESVAPIISVDKSSKLGSPAKRKEAIKYFCDLSKNPIELSSIRLPLAIKDFQTQRLYEGLESEDLTDIRGYIKDAKKNLENNEDIVLHSIINVMGFKEIIKDIEQNLYTKLREISPGDRGLYDIVDSRKFTNSREYINSNQIPKPEALGEHQNTLQETLDYLKNPACKLQDGTEEPQRQLQDLINKLEQLSPAVIRNIKYLKSVSQEKINKQTQRASKLNFSNLNNRGKQKSKISDIAQSVAPKTRYTILLLRIFQHELSFLCNDKPQIQVPNYNYQELIPRYLQKEKDISKIEQEILIPAFKKAYSKDLP